MNQKPQLSFWQIWNMCFGFLGIQFGFALQNANVSRIFQTLGANVDDIPILWIAAPLTGLIVQPIVGHLSDRTWNRLGRRRPYFLIGAVLASLALFAMPNSPALWIAAGLLWVLDASINISMEPFRAFVGDQLAPVPALDPRPILSMEDMGMGGMGHGSMSGMDMGKSDTGHDMSSMPGMDMGDADSGHDMSSMSGGSMAGMKMGPPGGNPLVDMKTMSPVPKLDDPGIGLRDNGRKVLSYAMLKSAFADPDGRDPGRDIELHLTGHMEKFAWSFNGQKFSDAAPLKFNYGERLRIVLVNDTMMTHPIHLHGMWSDLEDAHGNFQVRKHTIDMPPGSKRSYRVRADALGRWAYHCHLLYHMEAGMMREVEVKE